MLALLTKCAYFNTFYNAQNYYQQGVKSVTNDTLRFDSEFFDKTIEKTVAVIVKYPNSRWVDDAIFFMGASYYYKGDYNRALEKLELLLTNYPNSKFFDDALYYEGLSYFKQEKLNAAIITLNKAMESKQFKKKAAIALSYVYYKDGNYNALLEVSKQLLKVRLIVKERQEVLNLLGECQYNLKLYDEALITFSKILLFSITPDEKRKVKLKIARIYLEMNRYEECKNFLGGEEDAEFKSILADLNVKLGNMAEAKEVFLEVASMGASEFSARAYYNLAVLYENEDSVDQAIAYYDSAVYKFSGGYSLKAKKRSDILKRIKNLSDEKENVDRAQFLLAELYFVELKDLPKAVTGYVRVYENFPKSEWAPKALYARFWITKNMFMDDSLAQRLATNLFEKYPDTEYAISAKKILAGGTNESNKKE